MNLLESALLEWLYRCEQNSDNRSKNLNAKYYADALVTLMQKNLISLKGTLTCAHVELTPEGRRAALEMEIDNSRDTIPDGN